MNDSLLTLEEMTKLGGPYLEYRGYFTPWTHDEIVATVGNSLKLSSEVSETVIKKLQQELPSAVITVGDEKIQLFFPLTETLVYLTVNNQNEGES